MWRRCFVDIFSCRPFEPEAAAAVGEIDLGVDHAVTVNAVRLAGRIGLATHQSLGPSHAVNGDKILPIGDVAGVSRATLRWRYRMGAGLGALEVDCEAAADLSRWAA